MAKLLCVVHMYLCMHADHILYVILYWKERSWEGFGLVRAMVSQVVVDVCLLMLCQVITFS